MKFSALNFASSVTIASADPNAPAVFDDMQVLNSSGLTFKDLSIVANTSSGGVISGSSNIVVDGGDVHGAVAGAMSGRGLLIRDDNGVTVNNVNFHDVNVGVTHLNDDNIVLSNNTFQQISIDGIQGGGTSDILISGNRFTDFSSVAVDHPDAIQFFTVNTTASAHDITIKDNLITRGDGTGTQGIFLGNELDLAYQHLTITGNTVIGGWYQGIAVYEADNANISNNTVISYPDQNSWIGLEGVTHGTLANNVITALNDGGGNVGLVQTGNTTAQAVTSDTAYVNAWLAAHGSASPVGGGTAPPAGGGTTPPAGGGTSAPTDPAAGENLSGNAASNHLIGLAGDDVITTTVGSNYLRGEAGDDSIQGGSGFDDINGNQGADTLHGGLGNDWIVGGKDNDVQFGDGGNDIVLGNLGGDTLDGGDGADVVRGGQGDDVVAGGAGNDFISGDRGSDTITGGQGADLFHGSQDAGIDKVMDFNLAEGDRVLLDHGTTYTVSQVGADTVIDMGGGNQMILANVKLASLSPGWIFEGA